MFALAFCLLGFGSWFSVLGLVVLVGFGSDGVLWGWVLVDIMWKLTGLVFRVGFLCLR